MAERVGGDENIHLANDHFEQSGKRRMKQISSYNDKPQGTDVVSNKEEKDLHCRFSCGSSDQQSDATTENMLRSNMHNNEDVQTANIINSHTTGIATPINENELRKSLLGENINETTMPTNAEDLILNQIDGEINKTNIPPSEDAFLGNRINKHSKANDELDEELSQFYHDISNVDETNAESYQDTGINRREIFWQTQYKELKVFFNEFGNSAVPNKYPQNQRLASWIWTQRYIFKKYQNSNKPNETMERRLNLLNDVNFVWDKDRKSQRGGEKLRWDNRYEELKTYLEKNGHTRVPRRSGNSVLSNWVGTQRKSYRRYLAGEKCSCNITEEKIELLNAIGFDWFLGNVWEEKYSELKTYLEENGNFRVTNNPVLARWVYYQKMYYAHYNTNDKSDPFAIKRIELLDEIGFEWSSNATTWVRRYEELKLFVLDNGHSRVPVLYIENPALGRWSVEQRVKYKKFCKKSAIVDDELSSKVSNEKAPISYFEKRIALLKDIGFDFEWDTEAKVEFSWEEQYEALLTFVKKYGFSSVPYQVPKYKYFANWVMMQRCKYKRTQNGETRKKIILSGKKIKLLNCAGFEWDRSGSNWKKSYETLKKYVEEFDDARVPPDYSDFELASWAAGQRFVLKIHVSKDDNSLHVDSDKEINETIELLKEKRIFLLNNIGFEWDDLGIEWDKNYSEVKIYMEQFGDHFIAQQYLQHSQLGLWASQQRVKYEKYLDGDKTSISQRRIDLLDSVGFTWDAFEGDIPTGTIDKYGLPEQKNGKPVLPLSIKNKSMTDSGDIHKITRIPESLCARNNRKYRLEIIEEYVWNAKSVSELAQVDLLNAGTASDVPTSPKLRPQKRRQEASKKKCKLTKDEMTSISGVDLENIDAMTEKSDSEELITPKKLRRPRKIETKIRRTSPRIKDQKNKLSNSEKNETAKKPKTTRATAKRKEGSKTITSQMKKVNCMVTEEQSICKKNRLDKKGGRMSSENIAEYTLKASWTLRYEELNKFLSEFGTTRVPYRFSKNMALGSWVLMQRTVYKDILNGKKNAMTKEQIRLLNKIGFEWDICEQHQLNIWNERYAELKEYVVKFGNTRVPKEYLDNCLTEWVSNQQILYKQFQSGKINSISREQIRLLNEIKFEWDTYREHAV